jgi:allantoate deiminase
VRHPEGKARDEAREALERQAREIAQRRGVLLGWELVQENPAVPCSSALAQQLATAVAAAGYEPFMLASGAGHDGVMISALTEFAMLFVRCHGGVSHSPLEAVEAADVAVAIDVLERFLGALAQM